VIPCSANEDRSHLEVVLKYPAQRSFSHGFGVLTLSTLLAAPTPWPTSPPLPAAAAGAHPRAGQRRKVERDLRNTASSVSVKSASEIDSLRPAMPRYTKCSTTSQCDLHRHGGRADHSRPGHPGPNNGANVFWGGTVPRATINLDGHYLNYNEMYFGAPSVWDVDSIEVYRGPQTTSQGANAIAGAIVVKTKDPTFTRGGLPGRDRQLPLTALFAGSLRPTERQPGRAPGTGLCSARHLHRLHQPRLPATTPTRISAP
jgi:hypothetical protein